MINGWEGTDITVEFIRGDTLVTLYSESVAVGGANVWLYDRTVTWVVGAGDACIGSPLGIKFFNANEDDITNGVGVDNVRLSYSDSPVPPEPAHTPSPVDEVEAINRNVTLSCSPGGGVTSFDVYVGIDLDYVSDADKTDLTGIYRGCQDANSFDPCGLEYATTYYWRIDEANEPYRWPGEVWSFSTDPRGASNPSPASGAYAASGVVLGWLPGEYSISHDVYLSSNFDDVNEADSLWPDTVYRGNQTIGDNSYDTCDLEIGNTYYWRIDAINGPDIYKGTVWSFLLVSETVELANRSAEGRVIHNWYMHMTIWSAARLGCSRRLAVPLMAKSFMWMTMLR